MVITAGGWSRVIAADTPTASAQADRSFSFGTPQKGKPLAWASSGQVSVYSWPVRFVWHLDPSDDTSQVDGLQAAAEAMAAVQFGTNWQSDLETLGVEPKGTDLVATADENEPRVLVMTWVLRAQVFEARPSF